MIFLPLIRDEVVVNSANVLVWGRIPPNPPLYAPGPVGPIMGNPPSPPPHYFIVNGYFQYLSPLASLWDG